MGGLLLGAVSPGAEPRGTGRWGGQPWVLAVHRAASAAAFQPASRPFSRYLPPLSHHFLGLSLFFHS